MSFDTAWLDLREPADHAARDRDLLDRARRHVAAAADPMIVDLGSGTGSTMRAFGPSPARWTLVDLDETLLAAARSRGGQAVSTLAIDLSDIARIPLETALLVTASALIDLVGAEWIEAFAYRLAAAGVGVYAALNYDGEMAWQPADAADDAVIAAFNRHQRSDKGFGPALGPAGGSHLAQALRRRGYEVFTAPSPWQLDAAHGELHGELLRGIAKAAGQAGCRQADGWLERRLTALPGLSGRIGHIDVLAFPPGR